MKIESFFFSVFFSFLILYSSLRVSFTYLYYAIDTEGFIAALCENIDTPELECNGKCQLEKVIETPSSSNNKPISQIIDFKDILLYRETLTRIDFLPQELKKKYPIYYSNLYRFTAMYTLFHPPKQSS